MATLNIPYSFTAGTPAVASQVNANFDAIVNWANGGISTDAFGLLTARTIPLPSAPLPLRTIIPVYQTAAEPSLYIVNDSQGVPVTIVQDQAFGSAGKAVIKISDTTAQIQSGSPTVWLDLASAATAPALLVQHGSVDTMRLTRTQLDLFNGAVQATSAGVVSATTANLTTLNATTVAATDVNTTNVTATGLLDLTAPASDAIVAEIKGRSSDNNAIVQFKSNDDATVYASATSSPSGLTLNLPDTADSYTFQVNGVTKAVIDNNGVDAQYITLPTPTAVSFSWSAFTTPPLSSGTYTYTLVNTTFNTTRANQLLIATWVSGGTISGGTGVFGSLYFIIDNRPVYFGSPTGSIQDVIYAVSPGSHSLVVEFRVTKSGLGLASGSITSGSGVVVSLY